MCRCCAKSATSRLGLRLTRHGRLLAEAADEALELQDRIAARLADAFARGSGHGLLQNSVPGSRPAPAPAFIWWRAFAARYVAALCLHAPVTELGTALPQVPTLSTDECASLVLTAPMMPGGEYLTSATLQALWEEIAAAFAAALAAAQTDLQSFLKRLNPAWNLARARKLQPRGKPS